MTKRTEKYSRFNEIFSEALGDDWEACMIWSKEQQLWVSCFRMKNA